MGMFTGIDIGGTNTDIAFVSEGIQTVKIPNEAGLLKALHYIHPDGRLSVSTSQALNEILTNTSYKIRTITIPGPGLVYDGAVKGAVSHRGDIVEPIDPDEINHLVKSSRADGIAIIGKYSIRNPALEDQAYDIVSQYFPLDRIATSSILGCLNFPARITTTQLNAQIMKTIVRLTKHIQEIKPDFYYVTSQGGLVGPNRAMTNPSILYHSSPATVALGASYLSREKNCLVVDIGGTTTDLVPISSGKPMIQQIEFRGKKTHIQAVYAKSIPVGGDSCVREELCRFRIGNARAFGGGEPTLTDALNVTGARIGMYEKSSGLDIRRAKNALETYYSLISEAIKEMNPSKIIGTGYLSHYLIPEISERTHIPCQIPEHADCANAVGAAVSRVSIEGWVHADTGRGIMMLEGREYPISKNSDDEIIIRQASEIIRDIARNEGAPEEDIREVHVSHYSSYPVIRGGRRESKILDAFIGIAPGITVKAP